MKLTVREPASMTTNKVSRRVTSYFYSALNQVLHTLCIHERTGKSETSMHVVYLRLHKFMLNALWINVWQSQIKGEVQLW